MCGRSRDKIDLSVLWDCSAELGTLLWALELFNKYGMAELFPKLETVSIASIYGKENDRWVDFVNLRHKKDQELERFGACGTAFITFLMSGSLQHVCSRNSSGPLSIEPHYYLPAIPTYTLSLHQSLIIDLLPCPLGSPVRWVSDNPMTRDLATVFTEVGKSTSELIGDRGQSSSSDLGRPVDLSIYCSTAVLIVPPSELKGGVSHHATAEEQGRMAREYGGEDSACVASGWWETGCGEMVAIRDDTTL